MKWKKLLLSVFFSLIVILAGCAIGVGVDWLFDKVFKGSIYAYLIGIGVCFIAIMAFVFSEIKDSDKKDEQEK